MNLLGDGYALRLRGKAQPERHKIASVFDYIRDLVVDLRCRFDFRLVIELGTAVSASRSRLIFGLDRPCSPIV